MEKRELGPDAPRTRAMLRPIAVGAAQAVAVAIFIYLMGYTLSAWSPVPVVDGWPVYHRLMNYVNGALDLKTYLLAPHGAHLHSLIYGLYLVDFSWGSRQLIPHFASAIATLSTAGLLGYSTFLVAKTQLTPTSARFVGLVTMVVAATLSVEGLHPFQAVLSVSKFIYVLIFFGFVSVLINEKRWYNILLLAASCIAVTFHGSGLIFAVIVLLQHLLFGRTWLFRLLGCLPLVASFAFNYFWLPHSDGELQSAIKLLSHPNINVILDLILAAFAYYATPLNPLWGIIGQPVPYILALIGGVVGTTATLWSLYILYTERSSKTAVVALSLASIGIYLLLSAMSSALFWEARKLVIPELTRPSLASVMDAQRYTIVSSMAWAIALLALVTLPQRFRTFGRSVAAVLLGLLLTSDWIAMGTRNRQVDSSNLAGAGLLAGGSPIADEIEPWIWAELRRDWYWPNELPKVVQFMAQRHNGIAYGLPAHRLPTPERHQARIADFRIDTTSMPGLCAVTGLIPKLRRNFLNQPQIVAISDVNYTVLGYGRVPVGGNGELSGYLLCREQDPSAYQLFISIRD